MMRQLSILSLALVSVVAMVAPVAAQDGEWTVLAEGLNNPRNIFFAEDGTLYIAEAGTGGESDATGPFDNPVKVGTTAQISAVAPDGTWSVIVPELFSMDQGFGSVYGTHGVWVTEDSIWIAQGEGPKEGMPEGSEANGIMVVDRATGEEQTFVSALEVEQAENPDGDIISSNPVDLGVAEDGTVYLANAGCNCVMKWTEADGLTVFGSWPIDDNPVPTSVEVGPDGNIYVGFLTGFPFPEGGSRIEVWTPEGELVETYEGLTGVTGLLVTDDGTIYATQHGVFGDEGWAPDSGSVVMVSDEGVTPVAEGLNVPFGLAQDADGNLAVSINSASEPGTGQVISIPAAM
jgi:hypothetical protein